MAMLQNTEGDQQHGKQKRLNDEVNQIQGQLNREGNFRRRYFFWNQRNNGKFGHEQREHNGDSNKQLRITSGMPKRIRTELSSGAIDAQNSQSSEKVTTRTVIQRGYLSLRMIPAVKNQRKYWIVLETSVMAGWNTKCMNYHHSASLLESNAFFKYVFSGNDCGFDMKTCGIDMR